METIIQDPIIITGPPRSGTSLVAGIIHLCGAWGGEMIGPHPENPRGFFENRAIKQDVFEPYLFGLGYDLLGKREIPAHRERRIHDLRKNIANIIIDQGYTGGPWFYKNPMIALVYSAWRHEFPDAKWIFVRRDPDQNAESCQATSWMRGCDSLDQWRDYVLAYHERMDHLSREVGGIDIHPQKLFDGKFSEIRNAVKSLGLTWDKSAVRDFIIPECWG